MSGFTRNKLVNARILDDDTLLLHGVLDDDIYSLEMDVYISINELRIKDIKGKWNRWTTKECPRAIPFLREAVGFSMQDAGFSQKVHKSVGRSSCRHFANLLLECCHTAKEAAALIQGEQYYPESPNKKMSQRDKLQDRLKVRPASLPANEEKELDKSHGMIIDLHTHSFPASQCSSADVEDLIKQAKLIGLDGICLTDHNHVWDHDRIEDLRQKHGFLVLAGNEITTDQGDILVFGLDKDIRGIILLKDLRTRVEAAGGFMIAAHPFRGFLMFGVGKLGLTLKEAEKREVFRHVDAIEVLNGKVTAEENSFASNVAVSLGLAETGGSDAHETVEVGCFATFFHTSISDENGLLHALHGSDYEPIAYLMEKRKKRHERG